MGRAIPLEPFVGGQSAGEGIGLGLSIVRRLVEAQCGRIEVVEGKEGGALFRIRLPLAEAADHDGMGLLERRASSDRPVHGR